MRPGPKPAHVAVSFWKKVNKNGPVPEHRPELGPCYLWTGAFKQGGYGRMGSKVYGPLLAHRVAWMLAYGGIPKGQLVCHGCDNPACVRADHLFLGSHLENTRDAVSKGRMHHGERSGPSKLTEDQVCDIFVLNASGWSRYELAKRFGITAGSVCRILNGTRWSYLWR